MFQPIGSNQPGGGQVADHDALVELLLHGWQNIRVEEIDRLGKR